VLDVRDSFGVDVYLLSGAKLRSEERLAALARGTEIPWNLSSRSTLGSRRAGILLVSGGAGFILMFAMIARVCG